MAVPLDGLGWDVFGCHLVIIFSSDCSVSDCHAFFTPEAFLGSLSSRWQRPRPSGDHLEFWPRVHLLQGGRVRPKCGCFRYTAGCLGSIKR